MKKAQAAMEFLMTYGWAILGVMAAIGVLAYFGILSPQRNLPQTCVFQQGLVCADFKVESSSIQIIVQNGYSQRIDIYNVTVDGCDTAELSQRLGDMDKLLVNLTNCDNGLPEDMIKKDIVVSYSFVGSSLIKENVGEIVARVP
ncbi:hypothetical protein JW707_00840 [Candidatus Woesearchaeota archaeon]|nr:hypothetical protein [Candidatus Woesearchaeota archaeon]